jgi:hypothetical protein
MEGVAHVVLAIATLIGAITGLITILLNRKINRVRRQVDLDIDEVWDANIRRGDAEVTRKLRVPNIEDAITDQTIQLVLRPDVRRAFNPVAAWLRDLRRECPHHTDAQMARLIENRKIRVNGDEIKFGRWLAINICLPFAVEHFGCLSAALEVANEPEPLAEWKSPA